MNEISGKVLAKESGIGIPGLLVVVFDLDPGTKPEELIADSSGGNGFATLAVLGQGFPGDRLGSVLTDDSGAFTLAYEDDAFRIRNKEKRPDLFVTVLAPEEDGRRSDSQVLFASRAVRQNAGRTEQYHIRLTAEQLERAGIVPPTTPPDEIEEPKQVVERLAAADLRLEAIDEGFRTAERRKVKRTRRTAGAFRATLRPAIRESLSRVSSKLVDPATFVSSGESVFTKANALIKRGLQNVVNSTDPKVKAPVRRLVALTDDQKARVAAALDQHREIPAARLDEILGHERGRGPTTTFVLREDPLLELCREVSEGEGQCAALLGLGDGGPDGSNDGGNGSGQPNGNEDLAGPGVEEVKEGDINRLVARLMNTMTSPEERVLTGLEPKADQSRVEENIKDLSFPPSPADTPAFYDFHDLQIAFEHVWQEAIDEGILDLAEDAYHDIVELGGDPDQNGNGVIIDPVFHLREEGRAVLTSRRVVRDYWGGTLERDHTGELRVRDHQGETVIREWWGGSVGWPTGPGTAPPGSIIVPTHPADRLPEVLAELEQRLKEEYAFTVYAANRKERSVNFGILVTFRQRWEPLAYQAGKLAKTITLAPKETQKYSKKTVIRRKRAEKEVENHLRTRKEEASQTTRAEQEIIRKATTKTNFSLVSKGSISVPLEAVNIGGDVTTTFEREASKSSDDVKKAFHEAVFKAAQEYKDEHTTEVNTEETEEVETIESGEITNPNDEIAVTFLFYELQRRYRVSERIYRITPVVFVAQEVPRPDEIDEDWLLTYDWILRRVLLDDSFIPALNYLSQNLVGEQVSLEEMRANIDQQRQIVAELRQELGVVRERLVTYRNLLERSLLAKAESSGGGGGGFFSSIPVVGEAIEATEDIVEGVAGVAQGVGEFLFGGDGSGQSRQDALKEAIQQTADDERDLLFRLEREVTALNAFTEAYAKALAEFMNHKTQVARLRVHIKQNILYYMQAIWSHEPPDQRFFRLHKVPVPTLEATKKTYTFPNLRPVTASLASVAHRRLDLFDRPAVNLFEAGVRVEVDTKLEFTTLAQAADLDNLLGFKGNYMIFPLRESNSLTDFMMDPYVVAGFDELVDPDDLGNWTLEEFSEYVCCLKDALTPQQFRKIRGQLKQQYERLLTDPRRSGEVVTVPTTSLFIEALPARHSLIEEFKARHRAIDVKSVQADTRAKELENVRLAARLLSTPQLLEDPTIERKIVVENDGENIIVPVDQ